jgi:hypothetical protein
MGLEQLTTGWKPMGAQAGLITGQQELDVNQANALELQRKLFENQVQQKNAFEAQADMNNPELQRLRQQGIMGKAMGDYSTGKLAYDTLDSSIKTKLAENLSKASEAEINSTLNGLDMFVANAKANGPAGLGMAIEQLPPQYKQLAQGLIQQGKNPVEFAESLRETIKRAQTDSVAQRQALGKIDQQGAWKMAEIGLEGNLRHNTSMAVQRLKESGDDRRHNDTLLKSALGSIAQEIRHYDTQATGLDKQLKSVQESQNNPMDRNRRLQEVIQENPEVKDQTTLQKLVKQKYDRELEAIKIKKDGFDKALKGLQADAAHLRSGGKATEMPSLREQKVESEAPKAGGGVIRLDSKTGTVIGGNTPNSVSPTTPTQMIPNQVQPSETLPTTNIVPTNVPVVIPKSVEEAKGFRPNILTPEQVQSLVFRKDLPNKSNRPPRDFIYPVQTSVDLPYWFERALNK